MVPFSLQPKSSLTLLSADNILQEAVWHLTEGDLTVAPGADQSKDQALKDLNATREALRDVLNIVWSSATSEGTSLFEEFFSIARLSLADAAEVIEDKAGRAKESLLQTENEVQEGRRDPLGRDKQRLEEEKDPQVAWEHKMDTVKKTGSTVIGTTQSTTSTAQEKKDRTASRLQDAFWRVSLLIST